MPPYSANTVWTVFSPGVLAIGVALLLAHLAGDFVFQTAAMARNKRDARVGYVHAGIHAALAYVLAGCWTCALIPVLVFISHAVIDGLKARAARPSQSIFWMDQAAHLAALAFVAFVAVNASHGTAWPQVVGARWTSGCVIAAGAIVCVRVCAIVIGFWVHPYLEELQAAGQGGFAANAVRGLTNGGRTIGQWERALIFLLILVGQPAGIGFLVAAKSIFRFGELMDRKNRMEAEYITIGTLMSFGCAIAIGFATIALAARV